MEYVSWSLSSSGPLPLEAEPVPPVPSVLGGRERTPPCRVAHLQERPQPNCWRTFEKYQHMASFSNIATWIALAAWGCRDSKQLLWAHHVSEEAAVLWFKIQRNLWNPFPTYSSIPLGIWACRLLQRNSILRAGLFKKRSNTLGDIFLSYLISSNHCPPSLENVPFFSNIWMKHFFSNHVWTK